MAHLEWAGFEPATTVQMVLEGELRAQPRALDLRLASTVADWRSHARLVRQDALDAAAREGRAAVASEVSQGLAELRRALAPEVRVWLARSDGVDCGTFASWPGAAEGGVGVVEWLFVRPRDRRRGVASALIAHAVAGARARGRAARVRC